MHLKRTALSVLLLLTLATPARAAFTVGIADPGAGRIDQPDVSALGLGAERRSVIWRGEASFSGMVDWTPGLRHFAAVYAGYPTSLAPVDAGGRARFCGFVASLLERYPVIGDVIVWNEPNLAGFWGQGSDAYAQLLATCSPLIRAHGARVWAPGMSPASTAGVADFASKIAARGRHLIDGWDQHDYDGFVPLAARIATVRAAFGWKVPVLVGESGGVRSSDTSYLVRSAYCAGASGWLNFKLRDNGDWRPTGLETADGKSKPQYGALAAAARMIRAGRMACATPPSPPPVSPPARKTRRVFRSSRWLCPQGLHGVPLAATRRNILRGICVLP